MNPSPRRTGPARWLVPGILVSGGIGLVAFVAWMPSNAAPVAAVTVPPVNVQVQVLQPVAELPDVLDLTAVVEPRCIVRVSAEVAGRIERYGVRTRDVPWGTKSIPAGTPLAEGEPVLAGEPLVYLNTDLLRARYERNLAQYEYDEREYARLSGLAGSGSTSQTEIDDARTRRDVSQANLAEAARELDRSAILAPIGGVLNRLPMEIGEYASPGDAVAEIVDLDVVKVVVDLPERDVRYFRVGQDATVLALMDDAPPATGRISYVAAIATEQTRTTRAEIEVDNAAHAWHSGQIVRARLTRRVLNDVLMIPLASIIPLEEGKVVYVEEDGVAVRRTIEIGFIRGRDVRVLSGLSAGDRLIVVGHRYVGPGQAVRVVDQ